MTPTILMYIHYSQKSYFKSILICVCYFNIFQVNMTHFLNMCWQGSIYFFIYIIRDYILNNFLLHLIFLYLKIFIGYNPMLLTIFIPLLHLFASAACLFPSILHLFTSVWHLFKSFLYLHLLYLYSLLFHICSLKGCQFSFRILITFLLSFSNFFISGLDSPQ